MNPENSSFSESQAEIMNDLSITLKNNNDRERETKSMLVTILNKYDLDKYIRCKDVTIELGGRGYAFPSITISAWEQGKEEKLLAQFIHEQYHWIEKEQEKSFYEAIDELKSIFPDVPFDRPEGGGSEKSTYIHLIICRLELLALSEILGEDSAVRIVAGNNNYTWIRSTVLSQGEQIDAVINKYFPDIV